MKTCSKCGVEKTFDRFSRDKKRRCGYYPRCKDCSREYYLANREQIRSVNAEYRDLNADSVKVWKRQYADRRFFYIRFRNLKIRSTGSAASCTEVSRLWKAQRGVCPVTGRRLNRDNSQLDHIVPVTRGGSSTIENLRWVHRDANYAKRDLLDSEFITLCLDVIKQLGDK